MNDIFHELELFRNATEGLGHHHKSMFPSEIFLFYFECVKADVDLIVEFGTGVGTSSQYLKKALPRVPIISVDRSLSQTEIARAITHDVDYRTGEAKDLIPFIIEKSDKNRIGVLIDGPKGIEAAKLACWLLENPRRKDHCQKVAIVAVHDLDAECPGAYVIHSRTDGLRSLIHTLDDVVDKKTRLKHPSGPGLTLFQNDYRSML